MKIELDKQKLAKDIGISLLLYALPVVPMLSVFAISGNRSWTTVVSDANAGIKSDSGGLLGWITLVFQNMRSWGLTVLVLALGVLKLGLG
jgi:hypothetical protein